MIDLEGIEQALAAGEYHSPFTIRALVAELRETRARAEHTNACLEAIRDALEVRRLRALETAPVATDAESLGRLVREVWIAWACEQPAPKLSWLASWEQLSEPDREVDRRIGTAVRAAVLAPLRPMLESLATWTDSPTEDADADDELVEEVAALRAAKAWPL
jgi:hypothetical protein